MGGTEFKDSPAETLADGSANRPMAHKALYCVGGRQAGEVRVLCAGEVRMAIEPAN